MTQIMDRIYTRGDRLMTCFIGAGLLIAIVQAFFYSTWLVTITASTAAAGMFLCSQWLRPASFLTRSAAGVALQVFAVLYVYQLRGLPETYFYFVAAMGVMVVYQDFKCLLPGALLMSAAHFLFALLPGEYDAAGLTSVTFRFGFAAIGAGVSAYVAHILRRQTLLLAGRSLSLYQADGELRGIKDQLQMADRERKELKAARQKATEDFEALRAAQESTRADLVRIGAAVKEADNSTEKLTETKREFLSTMSHEIRTPMNGVVGMAGLLMASPLNPEQRQYAECIQSSADDLLAVINNVLDISNIDAGCMSLEPAGFDLADIIEEVGNLVAPRALEKGLELILRFAPETPSRLVGDAARVRQIILNLADNAIKFTPEGHVAVEVECLERSDRNALMCISVTDTGIGIAPGKQSTLIEKIASADPSAACKPVGPGLGLAIAAKLAEMMDGDIRVESPPGCGSTFKCRLRLRLDSGRAPAEPPQMYLEGLHVLVAEAHPLNQRIFAEHLSRFKVRYRCVGDGQEALAAMREACASGDRFQAVLIDSRLPDLSSEALVRYIRGTAEFASASLIRIASMLDSPDGRQAAGFAAQVVKPIRGSVLYCALRAICGGGQQQPVTETAESTPQPEQMPLGWRVLVVEDNLVNQEVAALTLQQLGCHADVAADGSEALEMCGMQAYDAILMDCRMPVMDGYEATAAIRRKEPAGQRRPIIAMTANALPGDREKCLAAGMDGYIAKPIRPGELEAILKRWVNGGPDRGNIGPDRASRETGRRGFAPTDLVPTVEAK